MLTLLSIVQANRQFAKHKMKNYILAHDNLATDANALKSAECFKSHCAEIWAYCLAPGHSIRKTFQERTKGDCLRTTLCFAISTLIFSNERQFITFFCSPCSA